MKVNWVTQSQLCPRCLCVITSLKGHATNCKRRVGFVILTKIEGQEAK